MFERYTEQARQALFFSRYEASQLGAHQIAPEQLLLGILRSVRGVAAAMLTRAHVDAAALQHELRMRCAVGDALAASVEIPFSEEAKRTLHRAAAEANALGHDHIGPEHLIVALLADRTNPAGEILVRHGMVLEDVRHHLAGTAT